MATGLAGATAQSLLNTLRGTAYSVAAVFVQLHTADPGAAGTTAVSANTTRNTLTWNAATTAGTMTLSSLAAYTMTATETITHISIWSASTAGTFIASGALSASKAVNSGDTLTFNTLTASLTPLAA
jgi:hypothetical protein